MSLSNKIAINTSVSAGARVVSTILGLLSVAIITRTLGQEGFGEYSTILAYLALFVILADLGLHSLMSREISKTDEGVKELSSSFFSLRIAASFLFLSMGFAVSFLFPYSIEIKIGIGLGAIGFFFLSVSHLLLAVFQRYLAMDKAAIAEIFGRGIQLLFVYFIYILRNNYLPLDGAPEHSNLVLYMFILVMSVSSFVIFIIQLLYVRKYVKIAFSLEVSKWIEILKATWPIALSIALTLIYFKIDTIFLSLMKPQEHVGIYGVAYRVLESLIFFPAMFAGIMMPILSREALNGLNSFNIVLQKSIKAISVFAFPVVAGGIVFSYSVVNLIGGRDFLIAGSTMQILFLGVGLIFFGNILGRAIIALDLQKKAISVYLFGMALNVVLNLIFIPKYTYIGAAWTTVFTEFTVVCSLFYLIFKKQA